MKVTYKTWYDLFLTIANALNALMSDSVPRPALDTLSQTNAALNEQKTRNPIVATSLCSPRPINYGISVPYIQEIRNKDFYYP